MVQFFVTELLRVTEKNKSNSGNAFRELTWPCILLLYRTLRNGIIKTVMYNLLTAKFIQNNQANNQPIFFDNHGSTHVVSALVTITAISCYQDLSYITILCNVTMVTLPDYQIRYFRTKQSMVTI